MGNLMDDDVLRIANSARKKEYQKTQEDLRGRKLENKKIVERNAKQLLKVNLIGTLVITSIVLSGVAFSNAKDKLIKLRGGEINTHPRTGYSNVVGVEEPSAKEVVQFMFDELSNGLGKGR